MNFMHDNQDGWFDSVHHHRRKSIDWVEASFTFETRYGRQVPSPSSRTHVGTSFGPKSYRAIIALFAIVCTLITGRLGYMQIIRGKDYLAAAEDNRERIVQIPSERGLIFDRKSRSLTKNVPKFSLALIPQNLPKEESARRQLIERLSDVTGKTETEMQEVLDTYGQYSFESIIVEENLDYETALLLEIAAADLPGIIVERGSKREYEAPDIFGLGVSTTQSLAHVIGYLGKLSREDLRLPLADGYVASDFIGKTGLEKIYETYLRGAYGKKRIEVNALGREQRTLAETPPIPGYHITLSIDAAIQQKLESTLQAHLDAQQKSRGAAVAIDPRNGEILALVSLPAYDNNDFSGGISIGKFERYIGDTNRPLFNRAISGAYPSGSTIKPIIAAAGLEEGIITAKTTLQSTGGISVGVWFFPDWLAGGHGATNVAKALAQSVNTFFYYIGGGHNQFEGLGIETIVKYLQWFGFGNVLGIDLPGETSGLVPTKEWKEKNKHEAWYIGDTYNLSIGQGDLLVTPLQIAAMTAAVANGGTLYRPHVVKSITHPLTKNTTAVTPTVIKDGAIAKKHLAVVAQGMRECVQSGSCRRLISLPLSIAGKTGTAQWNERYQNHAWFTSFAPFDSPSIAVTILIEEGGEGSAVAVPVAEDFYRWWFSYTATASASLPVDSDV